MFELSANKMGEAGANYQGAAVWKGGLGTGHVALFLSFSLLGVCSCENIVSLDPKVALGSSV